MMKRAHGVTILVAAAALVGTGVAVASAASPPATLRLDVAEKSVVPSTGVVDAGRVRVVVRNLGVHPHAVALVRTRRFADLPPVRLAATARLVEPALRVAPRHAAAEIVTLTPGSYEALDVGTSRGVHGWVAFSVR